MASIILTMVFLWAVLMTSQQQRQQQVQAFTNNKKVIIIARSPYHAQGRSAPRISLQQTMIQQPAKTTRSSSSALLSQSESNSKLPASSLLLLKDQEEDDNNSVNMTTHTTELHHMAFEDEIAWLLAMSGVALLAVSEMGIVAELTVGAAMAWTLQTVLQQHRKEQQQQQQQEKLLLVQAKTTNQLEETDDEIQQEKEEDLPSQQREEETAMVEDLAQIQKETTLATETEAATLVNTVQETTTAQKVHSNGTETNTESETEISKREEYNEDDQSVLLQEIGQAILAEEQERKYQVQDERRGPQALDDDDNHDNENDQVASFFQQDKHNNDHDNVDDDNTTNKITKGVHHNPNKDTVGSRGDSSTTSTDNRPLSTVIRWTTSPGFGLSHQKRTAAKAKQQQKHKAITASSTTISTTTTTSFAKEQQQKSKRRGGFQVATTFLDFSKTKNRTEKSNTATKKEELQDRTEKIKLPLLDVADKIGATATSPTSSADIHPPHDTNTTAATTIATAATAATQPPRQERNLKVRVVPVKNKKEDGDNSSKKQQQRHQGDAVISSIISNHLVNSFLKTLDAKKPIQESVKPESAKELRHTGMKVESIASGDDQTTKAASVPGNSVDSLLSKLDARKTRNELPIFDSNESSTEPSTISDIGLIFDQQRTEMKREGLLSDLDKPPSLVVTKDSPKSPRQIVRNKPQSNTRARIIQVVKSKRNYDRDGYKQTPFDSSLKDFLNATIAPPFANATIASPIPKATESVPSFTNATVDPSFSASNNLLARHQTATAATPPPIVSKVAIQDQPKKASTTKKAFISRLWPQWESDPTPLSVQFQKHVTLERSYEAGGG